VTPEQLFRIQCEAFLFGAAVTGLLMMFVTHVHFVEHGDYSIAEMQREVA
jgi:hypothetical protein